jgi:hypothetical protein
MHFQVYPWKRRGSRLPTSLNGESRSQATDLGPAAVTPHMRPNAIGHVVGTQEQDGASTTVRHVARRGLLSGWWVAALQVGAVMGKEDWWSKGKNVLLYSFQRKKISVWSSHTYGTYLMRDTRINQNSVLTIFGGHSYFLWVVCCRRKN